MFASEKSKHFFELCSQGNVAKKICLGDQIERKNQQIIYLKHEKRKD